jgi:hypothetical protein
LIDSICQPMHCDAMSLSPIADIARSMPAPPVRAGIRVVIIEKDPAVRQFVADAFADHEAFVLVGTPDSLEKATWVVSEYVPEVVVCTAEDRADETLRKYQSLFLESRIQTGDIVLRDPVGEADFSFNAHNVATSLAAIQAEVLSRKGEWLRYLIASVSPADGNRSKECKDKPPFTARELDDVVWARAQRNYVLLHNGSATWKKRGTLLMLQPNSHSTQFLRISRSCAVNRSKIQRVLREDNHLAITMTCGTVLQPSRSYLRSVLQMIPEFASGAA